VIENNPNKDLIISMSIKKVLGNEKGEKKKRPSPIHVNFN
jgi:hypothetical protein